MNHTTNLPQIRLTDGDLERIRLTQQSINLNDSSLSLTYGTAGQKKLSSVSDKLLKLAGSDDSAEIGERMSDLVRELRDVSSVQQRRGLSAWLFGKRDRKNLKKRYEAAAKSADAIAAELEHHANRLLRDFVMLGKLYEAVLEQYRELTVFIEAGQRKLEEDKTAEPELRKRFEKRLHDLKLSRTVSMQTLTQIGILQGCNTALSEKIHTLLTGTTALWKNQTALALAVKNTGGAMEQLRDANGEMIGVLEDVCTAGDDVLRESAALEELVQSGEND